MAGSGAFINAILFGDRQMKLDIGKLIVDVDLLECC